MLDRCGDKRRDVTEAETPESRWTRGGYLAQMWWCGDDHCDCHQPQIIKWTPNRRAGFPWITRAALWQGTFETDSDQDGMFDELQEAVVHFGFRYLCPNEEVAAMRLFGEWEREIVRKDNAEST
jgi:hypothetical protein